MTQSTESRIAVPEAIRGIHVIDADTHLTEPADLWTSRAPAAYKDRVPRVVPVDLETVNWAKESGLKENDGHNNFWVVEDGLMMGIAGSGSVVNRFNQKVRGSAFTHWPLDEASPAATFLDARLDLMDELGIWGQIIYPNLVGFGGQGLGKIQDLKLREMCTIIYNDAMIEFYEQSGGRLNGMAMVPWWDMDLAVREIERVHRLGLKGVNTHADPQNDGLPDLAEHFWEPLWEVCESLNMPINFHIGASQTQVSWFGGAPWPSFDDERKVAMGSAVMFMGNVRIIGNLIFSGILERHPRLNFVSVESGVGWIPFLLEALDYQAEETAPNALDFLSMKPSEYFHRQMYACFWFENEHILEDVRRLGYDRVMFETDFPHPTCLYPEPLTAVAKTLSAIDYEDRKKLLSGNAAKVYNLDVPGGVH